MVMIGMIFLDTSVSNTYCVNTAMRQYVLCMAPSPPLRNQLDRPIRWRSTGMFTTARTQETGAGEVLQR
jgi:hypothetical protein